MTLSVMVALLAALSAASPEQSAANRQPAAIKARTPERSPHELRQAAREAMRRQATAQGADQQAAVRELASLYRELTASTQLTPRERLRLRAMVRSRLLRTSQALARELANAEVPAGQPPAAPEDRIAERNPPAADRALLGQIQGNPGGPQRNAGRRPGNLAQPFGPGARVAGAGQSLAAMTNSNAQELIDLIQTAIAPSSWDVNGGLGTILYFAPKQVLVIRQRGDVHDQVGEALEALRGN